MQLSGLPLKYVIIDDDDIDRSVVEMEAAKFPFLEKIAACSNPVEAMEIISKFNPDIIFLDIEMPELNGVELIRKKITDAALPVFITSHPEFALESYELEAFDYLLKPCLLNALPLVLYGYGIFTKCVQKHLRLIPKKKLIL